MPADYVIVGAGLFGVTFARNVAEQGHTVVLVDKRSHIGGRCRVIPVRSMILSLPSIVRCSSRKSHGA